jgi:hypothetical protein
MYTEPLTAEEKDLLRKERNKVRQGLWTLVLLSPIPFLIIIFVQGRNDGISLYDEYGFWRPALLSCLVSVPFIYFKERFVTKRLQLDLDSGIKIVEKFLIVRKDRSFAKNEFTIVTNSGITEFTSLQVTEKEYDQAQKGGEITIRYANRSKYLFGLSFE